jgi:hypothetical protein
MSIKGVIVFVPESGQTFFSLIDEHLNVSYESKSCTFSMYINLLC